MKTIKELQCALTDAQAIMEEVRALLKVIDPNFPKEERLFEEKMAQFKAVLNKEKRTMLEETIAAEENRMATNIVCLVWRGIQQNLACFMDATEKRFVDIDYEDIHREDELNCMPNSNTAGVASRKLARALTEHERELSPVTGYYSYLETVAYKIAHYYGFLLGDRLLPLVEPGYCVDEMLTARYTCELNSYLKVDLFNL